MTRLKIFRPNQLIQAYTKAEREREREREREKKSKVVPEPRGPIRQHRSPFLYPSAYATPHIQHAVPTTTQLSLVLTVPMLGWPG